MIVSPTFIWLHVPKCGGSSVERSMGEKYGNDPDYQFDKVAPNEPVIWHQNISDRMKIQPDFSVGDRDIVACIRRLPAWLLSRVHFEVARNGHDKAPDRKDFVKGRFFEAGGALRSADQVVKYYADSNVSHWVRLENLDDDFKSATGVDLPKIPKINATQIDYAKNLKFWFTLDEISEMYQSNPVWAAIERRIYGNTLEDTY